jgi:hypothetical protein
MQVMQFVRVEYEGPNRQFKVLDHTSPPRDGESYMVVEFSVEPAVNFNVSAEPIALV